MSICYKSFSDLNLSILQNLHKFPHTIDLIVGIPRSGMLPANLLALYLNKPFTDLDSFIEGRVYSCGERGKEIESQTKKNILVIDDSYGAGNAYKKVQKKLSYLEKKDSYEIKYGVIYTTSLGLKVLDYWCEIIDQTRVFQWNLFHHSYIIGSSCFDIDGVLCPNPPIDDDGPLYKEYIMNAPSLYIPSVTIDTLVSCRLEKYRAITEKWLHDHNVKYRKLIMLNLPNKEERLKWGKHGEYKAQIYRNTTNIMFVESSLAEAKIIKEKTGKDVFCTETFEMLNADSYQEKAIYVYDRIKRLIKKTISFLLSFH